MLKTQELAPGIYLRWGGKRNRADDIADRLGLELVSFGWQTRTPILVPFRHSVQFLQTLSLLFERRPAVVFSHHTQPFCSLAAVLYARRTGADCVIDCHNGPFVDPVWQLAPIRAVNRFVFESATVNLVHNDGMREYVKQRLGMPGDFLVLRDVIPRVQCAVRNLGYEKAAIVISSFYPDEPVEEVLAAAAMLPDVHFFITGNAKRLSRRLRGSKPRNAELTGFLPDEVYDSLLKSVHVAVALSTRENILTRACHEALGAETPFVTSDSPMVRKYLDGGAVFVKNRAESIAAGVREALTRNAEMRRQLKELRPVREHEWWQQVQTLVKRLNNADALKLAQPA